MSGFTREDIQKATFRPLAAIKEFDDRLRSLCGFQNNYDSYRLAIGRSIAAGGKPSPVPSDADRGTEIRGLHLFGDDVDLWISIIVADADLDAACSSGDFRRVVEAHLLRGMELLRADLQACSDDSTRLLTVLSEYLGDGERISRTGSMEDHSAQGRGPIRIHVGPISKTVDGSEDVGIELNAPGHAPHIALMGRIGSGKTTTGVQIADQVVKSSGIPFLMIDPKGEFISEEAERVAIGIGTNPKGIVVGHTPIPLDFLPDAGRGHATVQNAAMQLRDSIALCCRGAGDLQRDLLRKAIESVILSDGKRDLEAIKASYEFELERNGKRHDVIVSRLNELTALNCFQPEMQAPEFMRSSWVLSLSKLHSEELKRLVILLVLDALKTQIMDLPDSVVDPDGYRSLRHLLVIDEARRILAEKKYQSLVDLVRQGRSKGSVVMLLSQDPSDFHGQADDFLTQIGTVIAFACTNTSKGLRALSLAYGRKIQPNELSDAHLPTGVALAKLPGREAERLVCWQPAG